MNQATTGWLSRYPLGRGWVTALPRPVLLGLGAAVIAIGVVLALWLRDPEYHVLFSNIESRDGGAIVSILNQRNIPYKFADNGATILVPADQVYALRLQLAEQGLPRGGNVGFELLNQSQFGASQFTEQVNYQRALEGEIGRSIEAMHPVKTARVHLAIPRQSLFVRERQLPTASVLLTLYPGRSLSESQVSAISWLVSSSVSNLTPENISIVDQDGRLLSSPGGGADMNSSRRNFINNIEQHIVRRILTLLNPIVGTGNVRAQANADVDFSQREQTSEVYRPNEKPGEAAIRSKQIRASVQNGVLPAQGVPGALSNVPPASATAPIQTPPPDQAGDEAAPPNANTGADAANDANNNNASGNVIGTSDDLTQKSLSRNEATINYEVDHTINHIKHELGAIKRLSVAVVVNYQKEGDQTVPLEAAELENINELVKQAMGYSAERGDSLSIVNTAFTDGNPNEVPLWQNPEYQQYALQLAKYLLILIALFFIWRSMIKPLIQSFADAQLERAKHEEYQQSLHEQQQQDELRASELSRYENDLSTARTMAQKDPRAVAMVLRSWMANHNHDKS